MPKVGNKDFPYTPEGMRAAREEAKRTGLPVEAENDTVGKLMDEEEQNKGRAKKRRAAGKMRY